MPMTGMTTMLHAVVSLQPSDSFSMLERTSNWMSPLPSTVVNAACSAGGNDASTAASGGRVSLEHEAKVWPFADTNGVTCVDVPAAAPPQLAGRLRTPDRALRAASSA